MMPALSEATQPIRADHTVKCAAMVQPITLKRALEGAFVRIEAFNSLSTLPWKSFGSSARRIRGFARAKSRGGWRSHVAAGLSKLPEGRCRPAGSFLIFLAKRFFHKRKLSEGRPS